MEDFGIVIGFQAKKMRFYFVNLNPIHRNHRNGNLWPACSSLYSIMVARQPPVLREKTKILYVESFSRVPYSIYFHPRHVMGWGSLSSCSFGSTFQPIAM